MSWPPRHSRLVHGSLAGALLLAGAAIAVHFVRHYPQPVLFGDPEAYYVVGQRLQQAAVRLVAGEPLADVFASIRDYLPFAGVGTLFALLDALRPGDVPFLRLCLIAFGVATALGSYVLARQLAGAAWAGLVALAISAVYPSYSVQVGRLFPEPAICCCFVWSAVALVAGVRRTNFRLLLLAGFVFTLGLFIRAQLFNFMLAALVIALAASSPLWVRRPPQRRLVLAFALGCVPLVSAWLAIQSLSDPREVERFGFFTFRQQYPYGFWQYLDADGYIGPYRLRAYPFYRALEAAAEQQPDLLNDRLAQWRFTAGYVAERAGASISLVLENMVRLLDRPANDYQWHYPMSIGAQVGLQRVVVVLAVAGAAAFVAQTPGLAGAFFVPLALLAIHAVSFPRPRYGLAAMPILIAAAAAYLAWLAQRLPRPAGAWVRVWRLLGLPAVAAALLCLALAVRDVAPEIARWLHASAWLGLIAFPFVLAWQCAERRRAVLAVIGALTLVAVTARLTRDQLWHQREITLSASAGGVEQEIDLDAQAAARLRGASEVFLAMDLTALGGTRGLRVEWSGVPLADAALLPAMPRMGEATTAGGRNPRDYPQWWALRVPPEWLPASGGTIRVRLRLEGAGAVTLRADRHRDQQRCYDGPSFGDWPLYSTAKLEHTGDYRLPVLVPIESSATRSYYVPPGGTRRLLRSVLRVRLLSLTNDVGRVAWETSAAPAGAVCLSFYAHSGRRGEATLTPAGGPSLTFPLATVADFAVQGDGYRLCYRRESHKDDTDYGEFALVRERGASAGPVACEVRFLAGMSLEPMSFSVDAKRAPGSLCRTCAPARVRVVSGIDRITDATRNSYPWDEGGGWSVAAVY